MNQIKIKQICIIMFLTRVRILLWLHESK